MSARGREKRFLDSERAFEQAVTLRSEWAVTRKFRRRDRGANVIDFVTRRERSIERNVYHDELKTADGSTKPFCCLQADLFFYH